MGLAMCTKMRYSLVELSVMSAKVGTRGRAGSALLHVWLLAPRKVGCFGLKKGLAGARHVKHCWLGAPMLLLWKCLICYHQCRRWRLHPTAMEEVAAEFVQVQCIRNGGFVARRQCHGNLRGKAARACASGTAVVVHCCTTQHCGSLPQGGQFLS